MSRAEGGAGTSRADAPRIDPAELFRREIPRPLHLGHTGGPRLSRPDRRRPRPTPHPRPNPQPPTHGPAREVPEPPSARGVRTGLPRWLALTHEDPDIGRGARPARPPAPHAHARLGCWTPRRVRAEGGPPGTSAPTILPPAPTRPRRWPHNGLAREVPAPPRRVALWGGSPCGVHADVPLRGRRGYFAYRGFFYWKFFKFFKFHDLPS